MTRNRSRIRSKQRTPSATEASSPTSAFEPHTRYATVNQNGELILQGRWLEKAGFPVGTAVDVWMENNSLIIQAVEPAGVAG